MLIKDDDVSKRLNNPLNLINRMRVGLTPPKRNAMDLFTRKDGGVPANNPSVSNGVTNGNSSLPATVIPASVVTTGNKATEQTPSSDDIIDDADGKIKLATAHNKALDLLNTSLDKLHSKVTNDQVKASSIPSIVASASKVITDIRKERVEREKNKPNENVHYHFYCPTQRKVEEYEVIEVNG